MKINFNAQCLPVLIGSLPVNDHNEAVELVFRHTPQIPLWVQLPGFKEEGMINQFLPGFPGVTTKDGKNFIDTSHENFHDDLLGFYEEYMALQDETDIIENSRFVMKPDTAAGFFAFMKHLETLEDLPVAVKGQVTGPVTFGLGLTDENGRAVFYDEQLRDVAVKLLALKGKWQVKKLSGAECPVIIFFDEPALAGFGSSAFISISKDEVVNCFEEVIEAVHSEEGLTGIHVCANADWSLILESSADIISFDAYAYFDRLILYADQIRQFMKSGGILAWGIVPTLNADDIEKETTDSLFSLWKDQAGRLEAIGIDMETILNQSLITPSCGTGSVSLSLSKKVLTMTEELSNTIRKHFLTVS